MTLSPSSFPLSSPLSPYFTFITLDLILYDTHTYTFYDLITLLDSGDRVRVRVTQTGIGWKKRIQQQQNAAAKFVVRHCSVRGSCSKVYYYNVVCLMECKERNYCYCCCLI